MKIEKRGVCITEVRGVDRIEVDPEGRVMIRFSATEPAQVWESEPLGELIEALQAARREALAIGGTAPAREPRVFTTEIGIPDDVTRVTDSDGDEWVRRNAEGYWNAVHLGESYQGYITYRLLRDYGPLTEVLG